MTQINWERFPFLAQSAFAKSWLMIQITFCLAANTVDAYARALEDYLSFCSRRGIESVVAKREHIAAYVHELTIRPRPPRSTVNQPDPSRRLMVGLANSTLQQRLTAIRLYYDYLIEEGVRADNPVGRGRYTAGRNFGGQPSRGLLPRYHKLPWIPTDQQWRALLEAARTEPIRNRLMLALAYDCALRREELCSLATADVDPAQRLLRIRAEATKNRTERIVPYSEPTATLYAVYLRHRHDLTRARGPLFLSESRRNWAQPVSIWTWSKVVAGIAERSGLPQLSTHTFRHLCLTDLARAGWELHAMASFAGHRSLQTTLTYIHLSGRDLAAKLTAGMSAIHQWRARQLAEVLQ
jgi:integrase/recombinase XerD